MRGENLIEFDTTTEDHIWSFIIENPLDMAKNSKWKELLTVLFFFTLLM